MSDTICILIYLPYLYQKTLVKLPDTCTVAALTEKLEEMYGRQDRSLKAMYLYFPEKQRLLVTEKTLFEQGICHGAILYWI